jgi:hypothetical protein
MESKNVSASDVFDRYSKLGKTGTKDALKLIPKEERHYKCFTCFSIVDSDVCPYCGEINLVIMCPLDHCHCHHTDPTIGAHYCPLCGEPVCSETCFTHDVFVLSRVTGYLSNVSGWNNAKKAEFKDRVRYNSQELSR